jgi:hypothetical protein
MILSLSHFRASPLPHFPVDVLTRIRLSPGLIADKIYEEELSHEHDQEDKKNIEEQAHH